MNVITWNCHMAFRKKYTPILAWKPDILIVPECENPEKINNKFYYQELWVGHNKHKGLGVFSFNNIDIKIHDSYSEEYKYILPITVSDSLKRINLIAIWSQNNKEDPRRRYIGEVWNSLNYYKELFHQPIIIAGDLNWNLIWDIKHEYALYGKLTNVLNLLNEFGISSVYHNCKNMKFGCEQDPTFFLQYKRQKPYHTDYIFASADMMNKVKSVHVGEYDEWRPYSDHMPLIVEFEGIL